MRELVKSLMELLGTVLADASAMCSTDPTRDLLEIKRRVEHEGVPFLMVALCDFASDFERGLERGHVDSTLFKNFKKRACLPAFLQGFTSQVFDVSTGKLLKEPHIPSISCVRQICLMWKKMYEPCTSARVHKALLNFKATEAELRHVTLPSGSYVPIFEKVRNVLWGSIFADVESDISEGLIPKHGPGATADKLKGNGKYRSMKWFRRLDLVFPYCDYAVGSITEMEYQDDSDEYFEDEIPVKVIAVPKTLTKPRIIAVEPTAFQYTQQALLRSLVTRIEEEGRDFVPNVRFTRQDVNQHLAMEGSKGAGYATLDLKDASDRVTAKLAHLLLKRHKILSRAVFSCRSSRANVEGEVIPLRKFASMGSALCFPIEATAFYTIAVAALVWQSGKPVNKRLIRDCAEKVHVYGDDIIIPDDEVDVVIDWLEAFGLLVNRRKSFWTGKFRESCGMDAYDGYNVTPTYVRRTLPRDNKDIPGIVSAVSLSNQLFLHGFWRSANYVSNHVEGILGLNLPLTAPTCPGLGLHHYKGWYSLHRWNDELHRFEVKTIMPKTAAMHDPLDGDAALLKFFINRAVSDEPIDLELEKSERRGVARATRRWVSPF